MAETDGVCLNNLPDTVGLRGRPKAEVAVPIRKIDPQKLVGSKFCVPAAYDEEMDVQSNLQEE